MSALIKWNYEACKLEALKFANIIDFRKQRKWAYKVCKDNGWLFNFFGYDVKKNNKSNYWTKEKCIEVAFLCKTKTDFKSQYGGAYMKAHRNGWLIFREFFTSICFVWEQL